MKYYYVIDIYERALRGDLVFVNSYDGKINCTSDDFIDVINNVKQSCIKLSCGGDSPDNTTAKVSILERLNDEL